MDEATKSSILGEMPTIPEAESDVLQCDSPTKLTADPVREDTGYALRADQSPSDVQSTTGPRARTWQGGGGNHKTSGLQRSKTSGKHRPTFQISSLLSRKRAKSHSSHFTPSKPDRNSTVYTNASLPFADTAIWDQKTILSLDGGGIRGYSALLILQALMKVIGEKERTWPEKSETSDGPAESSYHPLSATVSATTDTTSLQSRKAHGRRKTTDTSPWLPCHYFDYMAGTSTGGLISIMIGRLRMNIDDCIKEYEMLGGKVFGRSRWFHTRRLPPFFWLRDKYDHKVLRSVVEDVVRRHVPKVAEFPGGQNFAFDENRCRVVVVSYQKSATSGPEKPYLFRTYKNLHLSKDPEQALIDRNPALAHDIPIWQVARATSAAPTYFKAPKIDGLEYLDGGFGTNNPCYEIYQEVRTMNNDAEQSAKTVISIGTGKNNKISRFSNASLPGSRLFNMVNFATKWASESQTQHEHMVRLHASADGMRYYRLNVEEGLGETKLDEWRTRGRMRIALGKCIGRMRGHVLPKADGAKSSNSREGIATDEKAHSEVTTDSSSSDSRVQPISFRDPIPSKLRPRNKTLESITRYTEEYLKTADVQRKIEECASLLVEGRRQRAMKDLQRWEKACFGAWYQCTKTGCPRGEKEYRSRETLRCHLLDKHREDYKDRTEEDRLKLEKALDEFKIIIH